MDHQMIGANDFKARCSRAKEIMYEKDVDALCLTPSSDMLYLTGFRTEPSERILLCILPRSDEPRFIVPKLYQEQVERETWIKDVRVWSEESKTIIQLRNHLKELELFSGKIAISDRLWTRHYRFLQETAPKVRFTFASEIVNQIRMLKSRKEIYLMEEAARFAEGALEATLSDCIQGKKECELAAKLEYQMRVRGSEGVPFETIVASGPNSSVPHYSNGRRRVKVGDPLVLDLGAKFGHYCSDLTRTAIIGYAKPKINKIYELVHQAYQKAVETVRPGVTAAAVDQAARGVIIEGGHGEQFIHRTGHGIGLDVHESPYVSEKDQTGLEIGMTFSIEPGIYIPGQFGVRIEDVVVVTKNGCRTLTKYPTEMAVFGIRV